jgi:RNA polymerase sigma-70 factor (ECF subfamily)
MQHTKDLQLAEDALQDAVEIALHKWPKDGLPVSPSGWLVTVARRKLIDRLRRNQTFLSKTEELKFLENIHNEPDDIFDLSTIEDKRLELIFTCCHPSLPEKTRIALTLRTVGGLTTEEVAHAFLDDSKTLSQRLVRAKKKIRLAGIPYEIPAKDLLSERLSGVLRVIYLIFNEGYAASNGGSLMRVDLVTEAIRLTRILLELMPEETEVAGLLSLILLHDSRRYARMTDTGDIVPLAQQNRRKWDKAKIKEGQKILKATLRLKPVGPYQIQAAISAIHAEAASWEVTDWPQIAALYSLLYDIQPSPIIRINQAMAVSYAQSVDAALSILDDVENDKAIENYRPFYLAKADLLERSGNKKEAKANLEMALSLSMNEKEVDFLTHKLEGLR